MEAGWFKLDHYRGLFYLLSIIIFLGLSRWDIADGFEQTLMVELPPLSSRAHAVYQFGFVQAVDGFNQGIVVTVTPAAHQGFNACFRLRGPSAMPRADEETEKHGNSVMKYGREMNCRSARTKKTAAN